MKSEPKEPKSFPKPEWKFVEGSGFQLSRDGGLYIAQLVEHPHEVPGKLLLNFGWKLTFVNECANDKVEELGTYETLVAAQLAAG